MFSNYLRIAIRNLLNDKLHSTINVIGLSIGLGIAILMFLYISNELSYDTFHKNADRIYQVSHTEFEEDGSKSGYYVHAPIPFGPALEADIPEIEYALRFTEEETFVRTPKITAEEQLTMTDREFFDAFSFSFKYGNSNSVLEERYTCVLTNDLAVKYFGNEDPTGKTINILLGEEYIPITVDGVVAEIPSNSSINFTIIVPYDLLNRYEWFRSRQTSWNSWNSPTYIVLKDNASISSVDKKMVAFWDKYQGERFEELRTSGRWKFDYQPIHTKFTNITNVRYGDIKFSGIAKTSDPLFVYILSAIGIGILLLACINFMNLSVSRTSNRTKEISVRKVIGAGKSNLLYQFLFEAVFVSFTAMFAALAIVFFTLPTFNSILESNLKFGFFDNSRILLGILTITLLTGLIAGSYPALLMSSLKPVQIFSRKVKFGGSNIFTKFLIVLQFSLAIFFILGTITISEQLSFIQNKDLGFNKEKIVVINGDYQKVDAERVMKIFKSKFSQDQDIADIAGISFSFNRGYDQIGYHDSEGKERRLFAYRIDENFIDLMGINIKAGRNFSKEFSTDTSDAIIVNEALVKQFEIQEPIGKRLDGFVNRGLDNPVIIGVVNDFHFASLAREIQPAAMYISPKDEIYYIYAKLNGHRIQAGLNRLEEEWNKIEPEIPFQFSFLDEDLNRQYADAQLRQKVVNYSSAFAIFIAAIGLFGMSSYSAERRRKEIGIRKVLGASVHTIISLLGREFAFLVLISNLIAWPAAFYVLNNWLTNFAYRIEIEIWIFLAGSFLAFLIAMLTVSYHAAKAANDNPINSIKYE